MRITASSRIGTIATAPGCRITDRCTARPSGVGVGRNPPVFMHAGDTVEVELEGVGTLVNTLA